MSTAEPAAAKASKAAPDETISMSVPHDFDRFVDGLSPENRVAARQAKLAQVQAKAAYEDAKRAAKDERGKPERSFEAAKKAHKEALDKLQTGDGSAVQRAQVILNRLKDEAEQMKTDKLADPDRPDEWKIQIAKLQGTLDEYKASVAAVAAQKQLVDDALAALRKVSEPDEDFTAATARPNEAAKSIAKEQYELAVAQAQIPFDAAKDAFELKLAELRGSKPRAMH